MGSIFSFLRVRGYKKDKDIQYLIPSKVIQDTERILREYGKKYPPDEGLVYWGGAKEKNIITVLAVIAPQTESNPGRVSTSYQANFDVVRILNKNNMVQIAQVHSHPSDWVDHSFGDTALAAFKTEGLISIVVPEYCKKGMQPLTICGVHRYEETRFVRLPDKFIKDKFKVISKIKSTLVDFRKKGVTC